MDYHLLFITHKSPGRLPGAFLLPEMLGYHRQAAKPAQRKYARLGMTWAGFILLVERHRKAGDRVQGPWRRVWRVFGFTLYFLL